ncbi:type I-E CRISPR-associated protein Cse1/CasA [Saccharopolyspora hordei]|uniref:CRISPR system Cascade subunit CasA n=1 Tax=Saccharopolyspora hordei TaxID=1838 RepID=A0A853AMQ9_9PSEU|nr:type I-E CRISPR-associated protein Cse1/CasA [Saccharopolyspora hordei]NYI83563.1 CRISPR system Cascade subunit CasA [Saccharopolyspora hordei]
MTTPSFDLTTERWIPVIRCDGRPDTVSLRDVFLQAHELRWLAAEAASMTAALHRLLLAVLHRAVGGPTTSERWRELWTAPALPADQVHHYLDAHADEFDLFDAQRPFLQCPELGKLEARSAAQLVHFRSAGSNGTLFDQTTAADTLILSPGEAARWLVTVQSYDPGGTKTAFTKTKTSQAGLCNRFGVVLVEGSTLKETLLLNTCLYDPANDLPWSSAHEDRPAWEAAPPGPEPSERLPYGWLDLLTWPTRRVLLRPTGDGTAVDGVAITPGTALKGDELYRAELMAAFEHRASKKKDDAGSWNPVRLHELRGVWRHAREMLLVDDEQRHQRPRVLDHVAEQVEEGTLPRDAVFTIRVFGQQLDDSGGGSVYTWLEEQVPAPAALLNARNPEIGGVLGSCVALADELGDALLRLAENCRAAFRAEHEAKEKRNAKHNFGLTQDYWPHLPAPFAELLLDLGRAVNVGTSPKASVLEWKHITCDIARRAAGRLVTQLQERQGRHLYEFAGAHEEFERNVSKQRRIFDDRVTAFLPQHGVDDDERE